MSRSNNNSSAISLSSKDKMAAIKSSAREMRLDTLRNVGYVDGAKVIPSKRDKANDPRKQRKDKSWQREM